MGFTKGSFQPISLSLHQQTVKVEEKSHLKNYKRSVPDIGG